MVYSHLRAVLRTKINARWLCVVLVRAFLGVEVDVRLADPQSAQPQVLIPLVEAQSNFRHLFHAGGRPGMTAFGSSRGHGPLDDRLREGLCHLFRSSSPRSS